MTLDARLAAVEDFITRAEDLLQEFRGLLEAAEAEAPPGIEDLRAAGDRYIRAFDVLADGSPDDLEDAWRGVTVASADMIKAVQDMRRMVAS